VRLFIKDQFIGLYAAVESIDKTFLGRTFGADNHGGTENDGYLGGGRQGERQEVAT
jgi:hypothetical protein